MGAHKCETNLTIPVVMLMYAETNYVLNKYNSGLVNKLTVGRIGSSNIIMKYIILYKENDYKKANICCIKCFIRKDGTS